MKYHTTLSNIVYSILILALAIVLFQFVVPFKAIEQRRDLFIESVLKEFDKNGTYKLTIESLESPIFSKIALNNIKLKTQSDETFLEIKKIEIKAPLYRFIFKAFYPKQLQIDVDQIVLNLNEDTLSLFENIEAETSQFPISLLALNFKNSEINLDLPNLRVKGEAIEGKLQLENGEPSYASISSKVIVANDKDSLSAVLNSPVVEFGLTKENLTALNLFFENFLLEFQNGQVEVGKTDLYTTSNSLNELLKLTTNLVVDNSTLKIDADNIKIDFNHLFGEATIVEGKPTNFALRNNLLTTNFEQWQLIFNGGKLSGTQKDLIYQANLNFNDEIKVFYDQKDFVSTNELEVKTLFDSERYQLQISSPSLLVENNFDIELIEKGEIENLHLLAIQNLNQKQTNVETGFNFNVTSSIPFLKNITGEMAGDIAFDETFSLVNGHTLLRNIGSDEIEGSFNGDLNYKNSLLRFNLNNSLGLDLNSELDLTTTIAKAFLRFDAFELFKVNNVIAFLEPIVESFITKESTIDGSITLQSDLKGVEGKVTGELGFLNFLVENRKFNLATTLNAQFDEENYFIESATLTSEGLRATFNGIIDKIALIPEGRVELREVESGEQLIRGDFKREEEKVYSYLINSEKYKDILLEGSLNWKEKRVLSSQAQLTLSQTLYPISLVIALDDGLINLQSDNFGAVVDVASETGHAAIKVDFDNFTLPKIQNSLLEGEGKLKGTIEADYSFADSLFLIETTPFQIENFNWKTKNNWSLTFKGEVDPSLIRINDILYKDDYGTLEGSLLLSNGSLLELIRGKLNNFSLNLDISGDDLSLLKGYFYPDENNKTLSRGSLTVENFKLQRIFSSPLLGALNLKIVGETDLKENILFNTTFSTENSLVNAKITNSFITVEESYLKNDDYGVFVDKFRVDFNDLSFLKGRLTLSSPTTWRDSSSLFPFTLETKLAQGDNFFSFIKNVTKMKRLPSLTLKHEDAILSGEIKWPKGVHQIDLEDQVLKVKPLENGSISGSYDFATGELTFNGFDNFILPMKVKGILKSDYIAVEVKDIKFKMSHLNAFFLEPIITFESGIMSGDAYIEGPLKDPEYWGTLVGNSVEMRTFWTVGELISIKNPVITVAENSATIGENRVSIVHESGRSTNATATMEATLEKWSIPHYRIDILNVDDPISFWLPLYFSNVNIEAKVQGSFAIDGTPIDENLYGDIVVSDAKINFGVPTPPIWVVEKFRTAIDMTLRTGKNVSFVYPNEETPILRATLADDQMVDIKVVIPSMATTFSGELGLRSGEIYYIQKNFYVTEGSLKFPPIGSTFSEGGMPLLNLRARLREFDSEGNRVDIYLVLQDAAFDNLNPRFESIPMLSTNEILELLGQSIVASPTVGESGLQSVVTIASAATDVFSRLGLLQGTTISLGFTKVIRESLGLDVFTIRTNLLQNILLEALPGLSADSFLSPIARYLDNTTMYIGKYLFDNLYLQGMLHFRQDTVKGGNPFLANDLKIETELSVEWTNPLATFSLFTQPEELSVFDFFDTMGFSITKRFDF